MGKKNENENKTGGNQISNGLRDYSHLPRAKDFKPSKRLSREMQELKKATREALKALEEEEKKYGVSFT